MHEPEPQPASRRGAATARLAQFAGVWCVLAVARTALFVTTPGTAWHATELPLALRLGLIWLGVVSVSLPALVICSLLFAERWIGRQLAQGGTVPRRITTGAGFVLVAAVNFLYAASWAEFRTVGRFLDSEGWSYWSANAVQMVQHAAALDPLTLILVPGSSILGAIVMRRIQGWVRRQPVGQLRTFAVGGGCVLLLCTLGAWDAGVRASEEAQAAGRPAGARDTVADRFALLRRDDTGPTVHLIADLWDRVANSSSTLFAASSGDAPTGVPGRPVVSMTRYLAGADSSGRKRLNVIIVLVESLRADQLRAFGGTRDVMPSLDSLARSARIYPHAYTQASHTSFAITAPLASQYPLRARTFAPYPEHPPYPRVLLYDVLKPLGYRTAIFSSQNEHWGEMLNFLDTGNVDYLVHAETFRGPTYVPRNDGGFSSWLKGSKRAGKIDDRLTIGEAIRWIDTAGTRGPFFAYINLQNSHVPYERPADFAPRFGRGTTSFPILFSQFPPDSANAVRDVYANALAYSDAQLGRLFAELRRRGLDERTVIVVMGDHGEAFYEHGFAGHGSQLYDEVMHVPLVVRAPGLAAGHDSAAAALVDVPPTVLHLLGLPPHPGFQGLDLLSSTRPARRSIFAITQSPVAHQFAIVRDGWKLIYDGEHDRYLLFDLRADPRERRDLSDAEPARTLELAGRLKGWMVGQLSYYETPARFQTTYAPAAAP